ncbi:MAG: M14-type cytosolic carboxypeptidase, partial [Verrucomicrobiota bacterium]
MKTPLALVTLALLTAALFAPTLAAQKASSGAVRFNTAFEGAALGRIEVVAETEFRVHVPGQQDQRGRNRQATWYYFRMDNVRGRSLTLTLTNFLPGEYNDKPSAHMNAEPRPVYSHDGEHWQHVSEMAWDDKLKEGKFTLRAETDSLWLALVQPYTHSRVVRLLGEIAKSPHARVETV